MTKAYQPMQQSNAIRNMFESFRHVTAAEFWAIETSSTFRHIVDNFTERDNLLILVQLISA